MSADGYRRISPLVLASDVADPAVEAVIGDAVGPEAAFNIARKQHSRCAHDQYGDAFESASDAGELTPGSAQRCLQEALRRLGSGRGPRLDLGCGAGRTSFELAADREVPVLGVDLNWPLLHIGRNILDRGVLRYPLRRRGNTYQSWETHLFSPGAERVDVWIADARSLPFAANTFRLVVALNVLDCVPDPARVIGEVGRVTRPGGDVAFATPVKRAPRTGPASACRENPDALTAMLAESGRAIPGAKSLTPTAPPLDLPGSIRLHDTATVTYRSKLMTMMAAAN